MGDKIYANDRLIGGSIYSHIVKPGKKAEFFLYINKGEDSLPRITEVQKIEMDVLLQFYEVDTFKQSSKYESKIIMNNQLNRGITMTKKVRSLERAKVPGAAKIVFRAVVAERRLIRVAI